MQDDFNGWFRKNFGQPPKDQKYVTGPYGITKPEPSALV